MASCFPEEEYFDPRSGVVKGSIGGRVPVARGTDDFSLQVTRSV